MSTIIGSPSTAIPYKFTAPLIETATNWPSMSGGMDSGGGDSSSGGWELNLELELSTMVIHCGGEQASQAQVDRRYGNSLTIFPGIENPNNPTGSIDLIGTWVRVSIVGDQGSQVQFVGKIFDQAREMQGTDMAPCGKQMWVAYGGLELLKRMQISTAIFSQPYSPGQAAGTAKVGWIPAMNAKDKRGLLVGNKSDQQVAGSNGNPGGYVYGGKGIWSHLDYCNYLINQFIQQKQDDGSGGSENSGPVWAMGGQTTILDAMQTTIKWPAVITAAEMLRKLIPSQYGVDFSVIPSTDGSGFTIYVFALTDQATTFAAVNGSQTLPANPNSVTIQKTAQLDNFQTHIVESSNLRCDRIQVQGRRIRVAGTLWGKSTASMQQINTSNGTDPSLVAKWSQALETSYLTASGSSGDDAAAAPVTGPGLNPKALDQIRTQQLYRTVYRLLGAPSTWDLANGNTNGTGAWCVTTGDDGAPSLGVAPSNSAGTPGLFQTVTRETLPVLPLLEGFDYTVSPPDDYTLSDETDEDYSPDFQAINAWVYDENGVTGTKQYVQCATVGIAVHRPFSDWGVYLESSNHHILAANHATGSFVQTTQQQPLFDYNTVVATICIESDQRLTLGYTVPANLAAGDGSVMTIIDEEAECWVVLPQTVVDLDTQGNLVTIGQFAGGSDTGGNDSPDAAGGVLLDNGLYQARNDSARLALAMAGAISRYANERLRAQLAWKGWQPWANLIGSILSVIIQGDDQTRIGQPITSIEFTLGASPGMILRTGYA